MKILFVSHACVGLAHQEKLEQLAGYDDIELFLIVPPWWEEGTKRTKLIKRENSSFTTIAAPTVFTGKQFIHFYLNLASHLKRISPDVIHVEEEPNSAVCFQVLWLKNRLKLKAKVVLFTWQNMFQTWKFPNPRALFYPFFEAYSLRNADYIIAGNKEAKEIFLKKGFSGKVDIMPQFGIDPDRFKKIDASNLKQKLALNGFVIGYLGRLLKMKGLYTLLNAASELEAKCQLLIIGNGPEKDRLKRVARELGLGAQTVFINSIDNVQVPLYLNCMDVLVLPSEHTPNWKEQFGRVLVEAMACELPVIGSSCGEIPNVIGDAGVVFEEGNTYDLKEKLQILMKDKKMRESLSSIGRIRAVSKYTTEEIVKRTYNVYRQILAGGIRLHRSDFKMKVCFISGTAPPINDGIGDYTAKLIDNLRKKDIKVSLITTDEKQIRDRIDKVSSSNAYPIIRKWNIFGITSILKLVKKENFDIIHFQFPSTRYRKTLSLCLLPLFLRIFFKNTKVIVTFHEFSISYPINKLRQFLLALFSNKIIVTDRNAFNQISKILPWSRRKIDIIPIGSNIDVYNYELKEKGMFLENLRVSKETKIISFFGVIHSNKGMECLLKAVSKVLNDGFRIHLLIISQLDSKRNAHHNKIKELIDFLGIKKSIFWTGYVSPKKVSKFLSLSDICVLPFTDGVSLRRGTLMAALAHRRPVISTVQDTYFPEELIDRKNIFLIPVNDVQGLTRAVEELCINNELRQKIGEDAGCLSEKFSWGKITDRHLDTYKILGGKSNGVH